MGLFSRLPSDEWHHLDRLHWHGRISSYAETLGTQPGIPGAQSIGLGKPQELSTPYAVAAWLSPQIQSGPPQCQVHSNTGDGWVPMENGQAPEIADNHVLAAAQGRSVSVRIIAASGAYTVVAEAITSNRCVFNCFDRPPSTAGERVT